MHTKRFWKQAAAFAIFAALAATCAHADREREVNVFSFLTDAGKKMTPPTADDPATYMLLNAGYKEAGEIVRGEIPPPPEKVEALVRKALTAGHFIDFYKTDWQKLNKPPQLDYLIVFYWGYMNPEIEESDTPGDDDTDISPTVNYNGASMIALVAGDSINRMIPNTLEWDEAMQAAEDPRYFIFIAAYSPAAFLLPLDHPKHERKLLWRAQMSIPSNGITMDDSVVTALADSSVNYLGHPTDRPRQIMENLDRPSQVIVGTPTVKEYLPSTDNTSPKDNNNSTDTQKK